jgi:aryl-alcohol dehydrogenase-like predicted oxidoreductase
VITKLPAVDADIKDIHQHLSLELSGSRRRLGVECFEAVLLHRPGQLFERRGADIYSALQRLKAEGVLRKLGISVYGPQEALDIAGRFEIDLVQMPVSILDQRLFSSPFACFAREHQIEIHARSIYLQGLLVMTRRPAWFAQWQSVFDEWQYYLQHHKLSAVEACVRFVAAQDLLSGVVVGIDCVAQVEELLSFDLRPLSELPQWPAYDEALINPSKWMQT